MATRKHYAEWTLESVCELYEITKDVDPSPTSFTRFTCGSKELNDEAKGALQKLRDELEVRLEISPIAMANEATRSMYIYSFLVIAASLFKSQIAVGLQRVVSGKNGHGPVDYTLDSRMTGMTIGIVTLVKRDDFKKALAQNLVQLESSLTGYKRKMEDDQQANRRAVGIVTDAVQWYFVRCDLDERKEPIFKLSYPVVIGYNTFGMNEQVEEVFSNIFWLLEMAQRSRRSMKSEQESESSSSSSSKKIKLDYE